MAVNDHLYRKKNYECSHVKVCTYPKQVKIQIKVADNGQPYVRTTKMMNINIDILKRNIIGNIKKPSTNTFIEGIFFM